MSKQIEALKLALKALDDRSSLMKWQAAREALRQALVQPETKYHAVNAVHKGQQCYVEAQPEERYTYGTPLLDAMTKDYVPPQRTWVGLTTNEFKFIASKYLLSREAGLEYFQEEIEAKLKEKNT